MLNNTTTNDFIDTKYILKSVFIKLKYKIRLQLGFDLMGGYHGQPPPFALTFSPMSHEIKAQDLFMKHAPEMQIHTRVGQL